MGTDGSPPASPRPMPVKRRKYTRHDTKQYSNGVCIVGEGPDDYTMTGALNVVEENETISIKQMEDPPIAYVKKGGLTVEGRDGSSTLRRLRVDCNRGEICTVKNLTLFNADDSSSHLVTVVEGTLRMSGCTIHHSEWSGVHVDEGAHLELDNCDVYDCRDFGVQIYGTAKLTNCRIYGHTHAALLVSGGDVTVQRCKAWNNGEEGLAFVLTTHPIRHFGL